MALVPIAILLIALAGAGARAGEPEKSDLLWQKLEHRIAAIDDGFDGALGVAILDLDDGRELVRNADQVFPTASTIKLAILLELYRQEQQGRAGQAGKARLADPYVFDPKDLVGDSQIMAGLTPGLTRVTNRDLAQFMLAVSDNSASNVLQDRVGIDNVNATLRALGLQKTQLRRKMMDVAAARRGDENVATPRELTRLLAAIHRGKALEPDLTKALLEQLATRKEKSTIPLLLPDDARVANKPGSLEGVRSDAAIVYAPGRPFALCVMTAYARDERAAEQAISEIALLAWRHFETLGKATPYGRTLGPAAPADDIESSHA
jgi:beta-lactamase class A